MRTPLINSCLRTALLLVCAALPLVAFAQKQSPSPYRDLYSDTWAGTDALGRSLPGYKEAGPPRKDRTVGLFYFLTFEPGQDKVYDNSRILQAHPDAMRDIHDPAWGPLYMSHYWGEPLFGYYRSDDPYVLRKHAQMLAAADVDVIIFDNSNAVTYDKARDALCEVFEEIRRAGGKTPQIAFLCPFGNSNAIGTETLNALYESVYKPGRYADLWFRWQGKPLILASPSYADPAALRAAHRVPTELPAGETLGQTFQTSGPFDAVGGAFPTWATTESGMTLSLYTNTAPRKLLARQVYAHVSDNATVLLETGHSLPAGSYYLEMSHAVGRIGWWSFSSDRYAGGQAMAAGTATIGDRTLVLRQQAQTTTLSPDPAFENATTAENQARTLSEFFTYRTPIAPYNITNPPPDSWAWLQVYPQAPQRDASNQVEQITVGVAQNYNATVDSTAPMSVPGAFGRSYHKGSEDTRPNAVAQGFNFAEQWERARTVDPPFVFVTGWNEWTAGLYDHWVTWQAPPPLFIDQFNQEYSRDIEPMRGGHGDNYYYQLVDNVRRYKGARPLPPVTQQTIAVSGGFALWKSVQPEFRDAVGDPAHRDFPGVGDAGMYRNHSGRNDIITAKITYDAKNVYFYVRTRAILTKPTGDNWMLLFLDTDQNPRNGWLGYDFVVNRIPLKNGQAFVERHCSGYSWEKPIAVPCRVQGNAMMLAIPRAVLGITHLPTSIDFKWADNCIAQKAASDFTLNGDAAPDDRFNYRARLDGLKHSDR